MQTDRQTDAGAWPPRRGPSALHARTLRDTASRWLAAGVPALVVRVADIRGSTPREAGTRMLVPRPGHALDGDIGPALSVQGTIGGGHLEWQAIELAREALRADHAGVLPSAWEKTFPLGPTLGQCCGGVVHLVFEPLTEATLADWSLPPPRFHLELHGAGHVGQAIVHLLADIDCTVRWIDERPGEVPADDAPGLPSPEALAALPAHIQFVSTDAADAEVAEAPAGACHLVLTHRHDLDLRIITAVLRRGDFAFAGLIGSQTKRARFLHRLEEQGLAADVLARLTCPIGLPGLTGKEPAVIAISVVAQLLQLDV